MREIEVLLRLGYGGQVDSNILYKHEGAKSLHMTAMKIQVWRLALKVNFSKVYVPGSSMFLAA